MNVVDVDEEVSKGFVVSERTKRDLECLTDESACTIVDDLMEYICQEREMDKELLDFFKSNMAKLVME